jgi:hypothetical protein
MPDTTSGMRAPAQAERMLPSEWATSLEARARARCSPVAAARPFGLYSMRRWSATPTVSTRRCGCVPGRAADCIEGMQRFRVLRSPLRGGPPPRELSAVPLVGLLLLGYSARHPPRAGILEGANFASS